MIAIKPFNRGGEYRQGGLRGISAADIQAKLGFAPNIEDDPYKVVNSWGFTVNGQHCAVWDYKGSHLKNRFSTFGPADKLRAVFGNHFSAD